MTHVSQWALLMLWMNLDQAASQEVLSNTDMEAPRGAGCKRKPLGETLLYRGEIAEGHRPTCPECASLVWLATGERELGDGL